MENEKGNPSRRNILKMFAGAASLVGSADVLAQSIIRSEADPHIAAIDQDLLDRDDGPGSVLSRKERSEERRVGKECGD